MTSSSKELTEDLIEDLNGFGRYQIISTIIVLSSECIMVWSMIAMAFNGKTGDFWCTDPDNTTQQLFDGGGGNVTYNSFKACSTRNDTECTSFRFLTDIHTIVDEWDLVCDRKWIVATITTLQMAGVLVGCLVFGQVADSIGRKLVYMGSILSLVILNVVASFSVNWEMYTVVSFFIGSACGAFLVTRYIILLEFMSPVWRPRVMSIPAWSINSSIQALLFWALHDWKYMHLATAAVGIPFLFSYCFIQESSRWQMTKKRFDDARCSINKIAKINRKPIPDLTQLFNKFDAEISDTEKKGTSTYTVFDLFKTRSSTKTTLGLLFIWFSVSYSYYGLTFGVGSLAGNFFSNLLINQAVDLPMCFVIIMSLKKLGRRYTCVLFFILMGICGCVSGSIQYLAFPGRRTIVRVFSFIAKMSISVAWASLGVYTNELYPTVVRSIACGLCNVAAEAGAMLAPQTVFLGDEIPGLLYFPNAVFSIISGLLCLLFTETRDKPLEDTLVADSRVKERKENELTHRL